MNVSSIYVGILTGCGLVQAVILLRVHETNIPVRSRRNSPTVVVLVLGLL